MTKLAKFLVKNKHITYFLIIIAEAIVLGIALARFNITSSAIKIFSIIFLATATYLLVCIAPLSYLTKKPISELNDNCNPEPYFHITKELITYKLSYTDHLATLLDYCTTLMEMGELQKAYDILSGMNIDKKAGTPNIFKAIYYNNLASACYLLGDNASADIWCEKMLQIYRDMPKNKLKKMLDDSAIISSAEKSYRNGDYSGAMLTLNQAELKNKRAKVNASLLRAQIYIKAGNMENARKELDYVISNGNKCYDVTRAKEILNNIN